MHYRNVWYLCADFYLCRSIIHCSLACNFVSYISFGFYHRVHSDLARVGFFIVCSFSMPARTTCARMSVYGTCMLGSLVPKESFPVQIANVIASCRLFNDVKWHDMQKIQFVLHRKCVLMHELTIVPHRCLVCNTYADEQKISENYLLSWIEDWLNTYFMERAHTHNSFVTSKRALDLNSILFASDILTAAHRCTQLLEGARLLCPSRVRAYAGIIAKRNDEIISQHTKGARNAQSMYYFTLFGQLSFDTWSRTLFDIKCMCHIIDVTEGKENKRKGIMCAWTIF